MSRSRFLTIAIVAIIAATISTVGYLWLPKYIAKKTLLDQGIEFSGQSFVDGACLDKTETTLLFIRAGINVNEKNKFDMTPLHCAASVGNIKMMSALIQGKADVNIKSNRGINALIAPLHYAVLKGQYDAAKLLLESGAEPNANSPLGTPLHLSAAAGDKRLVELLFHYGADVHVTDRWGNTALHALALNQPLLYARNGMASIKAMDPAGIAEILLSKGVDVNAKGRNGNTALHFAAAAYDNENPDSGPSRRKINLMKTLLDYGADINATSEEGTPLLLLVSKSKNTSAIKFLLDRGGDPNIPDERGTTPLIAAAGYGRNISIIEMLLDAGAKTDTISNTWGTALHAAVRHGNLEILELLIKRGADVNALDCCNHRSVLHNAAQMTGSNQEQIILLLLKWGADVDARDGGGQTPLMEASSSKLPVVKALVGHGANVNAKSRNGTSVLWWYRNRKSEAIDYLVSKGARE